MAAYARPATARSLVELAITLIPFLALLTLMGAVLNAGYWIGMLLALPAAALLVRLFLIQHDCGHDAFFSTRAANAWLGRAIGVLTFTPHFYWRRSHAIHHARNGNLDARGIGDVRTLTLAEYRESTRLQRFGYRLYRHPLVLFGVGGAFIFIIQFRLPVGLMREGWKPWASTMATNAVIAALVLGIGWFIGVGLVLLIYIPVLVLAASAGVWLFYVQHQFDGTTWERQDQWSFHEAALHGSSHYDLPAVLRWITANIGIHHVHHLSSRIPFYRLGKVLRDKPELREVGRLTLRESFRTAALSLWDEDQRRLVTFREARAMVGA